MSQMTAMCVRLVLIVLGAAGFIQKLKAESDPSRVLPVGEKPADGRLQPPRMLRDKYHPWDPPQTLEAWRESSGKIRDRLLVSNGLWPMPEPAPLKPVIHGKIERDGYTIEKVFFASHPGHYVSGNLYRPTALKGKAPGVLCPHGHWQNGRFFEANHAEVQKQISSGAEKFECGAKYPLQARMVGLVRMGCVVFHYDMTGNADSRQIGHAAGFKDVEAELWMQNFMGLQTFNSRCALDFLLSLPDVDADRIGVTGSSGGGTQTFMLCGIDERPHVAFPAVMVSTAMQGGCICENCSYLRQDLNNVAIAGLFAPRPMAMSGADDWTIDIETKGLPELKAIYGLYGASEKVHAKCFPQFGHNYNQPAREMMYSWFNQYLKLGIDEPIEEREFIPVPPKQLSVYDDEHQLPSDAFDAVGLRDHLTKTWQKNFSDLVPKTTSGVESYRNVVGKAAQVMVGDVEEPGVIEVREVSRSQLEGNVSLVKIVLDRPTSKQQLPAIVLSPENFNGTGVLWIDGEGKKGLFTPEGKLSKGITELIKSGRAVLAADLYQTGEFVVYRETARPEVNQDFAGYTYGYNRPWFSERVRDIRMLLKSMASREYIQKIELVAVNGAGPWGLTAAGESPKKLQEVAVDLKGFGFGKIQETADPNLLPGGLKYGGIGGLGALAAPLELHVWGTEGVPLNELAPLQSMYAVAADGKLHIHKDGATTESVVGTLIER